MVTYTSIAAKPETTGNPNYLYAEASGAVVKVPTGGTATNYIAPTTMSFTAADRLLLTSGTALSPTASGNPIDWFQKHTSYDAGTDMFAHRPASVREVVVYGTGIAGATNTDATWIGFLGNGVIRGSNAGTSAAPDYDARGNIIGVAGFARSDKPSDGIVTGLWGYGSTPSMDATEFAAWSTAYTTVGLETNVDIRHPDPGAKTVVSGTGTTVGWYSFNYQTPGGGVKDMSFGFAANGNPNDGNWSSTNIDNWNGFYVFGLIDKVKTTGLLFGQYFKNGAVGIKFSSLVGGNELASAIDIGNNKINVGEYTGSTFANNDVWHNGGNIFFRYGGATHTILKHAGSTVTGNAASNFAFTPSGGATQFNIGYVASAVNYIGVFAAATGNTSAIVAQGSDTNRSIELRTAGTGRVWIGPWTTNADTAVNGYIEVKDSTGTTRKVATIA